MKIFMGENIIEENLHFKTIKLSFYNYWFMQVNYYYQYI